MRRGQRFVAMGEQKTIEPEHIDHSSHFSWTHGFMFPVYGAIIVAVIAGLVKIYLAKRKSQ